MIKKNVGRIDKVVRLILVGALVVAGVVISPWFYLSAALLLATVAMGFCGFYTVCGIDTIKE